MNSAANHYFWKPLKTIGRSIEFFDGRSSQIAAFGICALTILAWRLEVLPSAFIMPASYLAAIASILPYIRAYSTKADATICWNLLLLGNLYGVLFLALASANNIEYVVVCVAGILAAFVCGHACLRYMRLRGESQAIRDYQGSMYVFNKIGHLFFAATLLVMAFPISPSFVAQEILLSSFSGNLNVQIVLFCFAYLLVGVSAMRLYIKVFFGPHKSSYHEKAFKSS